MRGSWLDRTLRIMGDVRPREGRQLLLLASNLMLLLFAYYLLKTVREPLVLSAGGAEVKSYASAAQAVLLVGIASAFGWLASRLDRIKLLTTVSVFFIANLVLFFLLFTLLPNAKLALSVAFFIWVGCFSLMMIAQFWAFANDLYTKDQGERLFGIIAGGSAIGAVLGAKLAKPLYHSLGPYGMMLLAAGVLVLSLGLTWWSHWAEHHSEHHPSHEPGDKDAHAARKQKPEKLAHGNGFSLMLHDKYLLFVGALSLLKNWVNTTGEYILDRRLLEVAAAKIGQDVHAQEAYIAGFKSDYFTYVNLSVLVLQLFAVSRLVKYIGVRKALFILPMLALGSYTTMAFVPILTVIFIGKIVENTTDYSLQKTCEQMLFLVTSREAKYKVKAIVDTVFVRMGDVLSAAVVWLGTRMGLQTGGFIAINIGLVLCWLALVWALSRSHTKREAESKGRAPAEKPAAKLAHA